MPVSPVHEVLATALPLWASIVGVDVYESKYGRARTIQQWGLRSIAEDLAASQQLDESGVATLLMLRAVTQEHLKEEQISAWNLLHDRASVDADVALRRQLWDVLHEAKASEEVEDFYLEVRAACELYGCPAEDVETWLASTGSMGFVRRDAFKSLETLEAHKFLDGKPSGCEPRVNRQVWEFWNVNSLLRALRSQALPGVTICLIRDPEALHSFFCISVVDGDRMFVLTDRDRHPHPLAKEMSRRPDRELVRRASRHRFPYQLLDLKSTEDQKALYAEARTALVPVNAAGVPLAPLGELYVDQIAWVSLLLDLVREKFYRSEPPALPLSYTGEMVVQPHAWVGASSALVLAGTYEPLQAPRLTSESINDRALDPECIPATGEEDWMLERYGADVPEDAINLTGNASRVKLLADAGKVESVAALPFIERWGTEKRTDIMTARGLRVLDPTYFGTAEQVKRDRVFVGKFNRASIIQKRAELEHEQTREKVIQWYKDAVKRNAGALLDAAAQGTLMLPSHNQRWYGADGKPARSGSIKGGGMHWRVELAEALTLRMGSSWNTSKIRDDVGLSFTGACLGDWRTEECFDTGAAASVFGYVRVDCSEAIAAVCGVSVEELPWQLRHVRRHRQTGVGNPNLDRVDPADWVLHNPWDKMHLDIAIMLSKRAVAARRKRLGLSGKLPEVLNPVPVVVVPVDPAQPGVTYGEVKAFKELCDDEGVAFPGLVEAKRIVAEGGEQAYIDAHEE